MKILEQINQYHDELIQLRRDFHQHPELGFEEHRTATIIESYLQDLGLSTKRTCGTGVIAVIEGDTPGPTIMLRADMDALPIKEQNKLEYASATPGIMHACGHDAHMAMLLITAKILVNNREAVKGSIKIVFQPNEEVAGAIDLIEDGVLDNPKVDGIIGIHVWPTMNSGNIGITSGPIMAGLDVFKVTIHGQGGHTGMPEKSVDPILTAANLIQNVQMIQTREISNLKPTSIMFGKIEGGSKSNIIPDKVNLEGSIRFLYKLDNDDPNHPTERFKQIANQVCATHRCSCDIEIIHENTPLINDPVMVDIARTTVKEVFQDKIGIVDNVSITGEDFSEYCAYVPGVFMFLGVGNREKETDFALHNPRFNLDEDVLSYGVAMYTYTALNFLNNNNLMDGRW